VVFLSWAVPQNQALP